MVKVRSGVRGSRSAVLVGVVSAFALVLVACGGGDESSEAEVVEESVVESSVAEESVEEGSQESEESEGPVCPLEGGQVRIFGTNDTAGVAGSHGPGIARSAGVWVDELNAAGGILGCEIVLTQPDEPFPDVDECLRKYREAAASEEVDVFFGPFNSACMAQVPDITNPAGVPLVAAIGADHLPFTENFQRYNFHPAVSTLLEGRAAAKWFADAGYKRVAMIVPGYAYGRDLGSAFQQYFLELVPDGEIVAVAEPPAGEQNMLPYIQALVEGDPDAVFGGLFAGDTVTFWTQWKAAGYDQEIPAINLVGLNSVANIDSADQIPANTLGYIRAFWSINEGIAPVGTEFAEAYRAVYENDADPSNRVPHDFGFPFVSALEMTKALAEATGGFDAEAWAEVVESGEFSFMSPYSSEPTTVQPDMHHANGCVTIGPIIFDDSLPIPVTYDPELVQRICLEDVVTDEQAQQLVKK